MKVEGTVEVWDEEQLRWVPGDMELDGPEYATVRSAEETGKDGLPAVYVLTQATIGTHLRRRIPEGQQ